MQSLYPMKRAIMKATQEELVQNLQADPILKMLHLQLSRIFTYAIPMGLIVEGEATRVVYDAKVEKLLEEIRDAIETQIKNNYSDLINIKNKY